MPTANVGNEVAQGAGVMIASGSGSPEGFVTGPPGMLWLQTDVGLWQKLSGTNEIGWALVGGGGAPDRATVSKTTGTLASAASEDGTIDFGASTVVLLQITADIACRVRFYATSASRTADADRLEGVDPTPGTGTMSEFIFLGSGTILTGPPPVMYNGDAPAVNTLYYRITNKTGSPDTITIDLIYLGLES